MDEAMARMEGSGGYLRRVNWQGALGGRLGESDHNARARSIM